MSVLNGVGYVVRWVTWVLRSVGAWVAWVEVLRGLRGLRGSICFLGGSSFYVGHNFYVGCVGQIYFCVGQNFFVWVQYFLRGSNNFCSGQFLGVSLKKISIGAFTIIS